jgi:hypothetical protein
VVVLVEAAEAPTVLEVPVTLLLHHQVKEIMVVMELGHLILERQAAEDLL